VGTEQLAAIGEMVIARGHDSRNALQQIQACLAMLEPRVEGDREACELIVDLRRAEEQLRGVFDEVRRLASPQRAQLNESASGASQ
jgi:hypothetical protein